VNREVTQDAAGQAGDVRLADSEFTGSPGLAPAIFLDTVVNPACKLRLHASLFRALQFQISKNVVAAAEDTIVIFVFHRMPPLLVSGELESLAVRVGMLIP